MKDAPIRSLLLRVISLSISLLIIVLATVLGVATSTAQSVDPTPRISTIAVWDDANRSSVYPPQPRVTTLGSMADPDALVILPLDESSGTLAGDVSGMNNDGTLTGGAVFEATSGDGSAGAVRFDGTDDFIDLGILDVNGSGLTLALWFNADTFPGPSSDPRLISKASGVGSNDHVFMLGTVQDSGEIRLRARVRIGGTATTLIATSGGLVAGVWRHAAVTYDGTTLRLYLDAVEVGSTPLSGSVDMDPLIPVTVGSQPPGAGPRFFDGLIDDVRILQRAMGIAEIESIVNGNPAPVAVDDSYETAVDDTLVVSMNAGVLSNDVDNNPPDDLAAVLLTSPANGILAGFAGDGSFSYVPDPGFSGLDSLTYQAVDGGSGLDSPATVRITVTPVTNTPPLIVTGFMVLAKQTIGVNVDQTHAVVAADLNGDGDVDVVATDYLDDSVFWYENDGVGGFVFHVVDAALDGAYPVDVADVDLDGDTDILACGYLGDTVVWYENNGTGGFTRRDVDTAADGAHSVVTGDMDEDGDIDLLTTNQDAGSVAWYENDGNQNFTQHTIDATSTMAKRAEFADIDGDGDLDVVSASFNDEIAWHENDGSENFTKRLIDTTANGAYFVSPADVDGDMDVDVLAASQLDNTVAVYLNDGNGVFTPQTIDSGINGTRMVIAVDIDRDGDQDALANSVDLDTVFLFENNGSGIFTKRVVDAAANGAYGVFAADMDRDGDVDILSARRDANTVVVHHQSKSHQAQLLEAGGVLIITAGHLLTTDLDDTPAELTYTLIDGPDWGELRVDGIVVPGGGTFTQDIINSNRLTYVHDGSTAFLDIFTFTVADGGEGGFLPVSGSFTINISDLADGHLAEWPLDESSGLVAPDVVGGYDGTLVGGPVWQPSGGRIGGALEFDGTDDYVDIGSIDVAGGSGITLMMWVRPTAFVGDSRMIAKTTGTAEQDHYWMISTYLGSAVRFRLKAGGTTFTLITGLNELEVGEWSFVACTYDEAEMRIYVDGILAASVPKTGTVDVDPVVPTAIGNQPPGAGIHPFSGYIDDVHVYRRALSEGEIAALAANPTQVGVGEGVKGAAHTLHQNVPNPFQGSTAVMFNLATESEYRITICDLSGRRVRLFEGAGSRGHNQISWNGRSETGELVSSGVYFYTLAAGAQNKTKKMVVIK